MFSMIIDNNSNIVLSISTVIFMKYQAFCLQLPRHVTQSIPGLSHIDKDTELMKRSIQHAKTHNKTKNDRHENNKGLRDCHYCWCLTCSFCILERTIRLCQSNELHRASTNRTDGDLDRGEACQTQSDEKGETKIPPCFQTRRYISIMPP